MVASIVHSGDVQRLFLQAAISRRIVSERLAKLLWQKCAKAVKNADDTLQVQAGETDDEWNDFVNTLNKMIDPFDLEFRSVVDENTSKKLYAIVNTKGDEVAQMASDYTPAEIAYFKAVVEQIMLSSNNVYSISSMAALREVGALKTTMTKTQAETVLGSFVAKGWLLRSKRGRYSLAARTILELNAYLRSHYEEEILDCMACGEMVTNGITCAKHNCSVYFHRHCYNLYRRTKSSCPSCTSSWATGDGIAQVGEAAGKDGHDERRKVRRKNTENSDEEMDQSHESSSQPQTLTQTQSQSQSQRATQSKKGKKVARDKKVGRGKRRAGHASSAEEQDDDDSDAMNIDNLA